MRLKLRTKILWRYVIGVILFSCAITLFITHRVYHKKKVLQQNIIVSVVIVDKDCDFKNDNKCRLYINNNSKKQHINVSRSYCQYANIGDTMTAFYDKEYDLFFKDLDDLKDEYYGLIGFTILGIILLISCFFELNI